MRSFNDIKNSYNFTGKDENRLLAVSKLMEEHAAEVVHTVRVWLSKDKETAENMSEDMKRQFFIQEQWLASLFKGPYNHRFYESLGKIGTSYSGLKINQHLINRTMNIVRSFSTDLVVNKISDKCLPPGTDTADLLVSIGKLFDIVVDVIIAAYLEAELKESSPVYKVKSMMINFAEQFSQLMNMILVVALIGLTVGAVGMFVNDVYKLVINPNNFERGIISALGTVLVLWVMIRLMSTEIALLKGGKFNISVFIGVALVTVIRETMIATLKHDKPEAIYYLIAAIFVIGIIYWLIKKHEDSLITAMAIKG